jgi:putative hydrolase of the HAD superfamily
MKNSFHSIFFDVGNTLLFPNRERILSPLKARHAVPTDAHWRDLEARTKNKFDDVLEHNGRADHSFWWMFYTGLLEELGLQDNAIRDQLVEATRTSSNWDVIRPGTCDLLNEIGRSYQIGVISNADGKIAELLDRCGIAGCFRCITDSGVVGREKPDPAIFAAALQAMGERPEHSLYVGDVYSVDYLGATRAGMQAALFDVAGAYKDKGLPRVETLEQLQEHLAQ